MSNWVEVHEDYQPILQSQEGSEESVVELGPDIWRWAIEVVNEWVATGVEQDLPVESEFIDAADEWFVKQVNLVEEGGRGIITVNGVVVFTPVVSGH